MGNKIKITKTTYTLWCGCVLVYVKDKPIQWTPCESGDDCELSFDERADLKPVMKENQQ